MLALRIGWRWCVVVLAAGVLLVGVQGRAWAQQPADEHPDEPQYVPELESLTEMEPVYPGTVPGSYSLVPTANFVAALLIASSPRPS